VNWTNDVDITRSMLHQVEGEAVLEEASDSLFTTGGGDGEVGLALFEVFEGDSFGVFVKDDLGVPRFGTDAAWEKFHFQVFHFGLGVFSDLVVVVRVDDMRRKAGLHALVIDGHDVDMTGVFENRGIFETHQLVKTTFFE